MAKKWRIRSLTEIDDDTLAPLYWSNRDGWVDRQSAGIFSDAERKRLRLPIGGEWAVTAPGAGRTILPPRTAGQMLEAKKQHVRRHVRRSR
jgi:hypothetical protein